MILIESDTRFYLANSAIPGAGGGLFARAPLAAGEELRVVGVVIPANTVSDECTRYADEYKFRAGDALLIPVGYGGMVNHSSKAPNMEKVVVGNSVYLRTLRPIAADEELLFCYSEYAQTRFQLEG
jgi:SET domain-containing protein